MRDKIFKLIKQLAGNIVFMFVIVAGVVLIFFVSELLQLCLGRIAYLIVPVNIIIIGSIMITIAENGGIK